MRYRFQARLLKQSAISALLVGVASGLTIAIQPLFDGRAPLLFFTIAVILAAGSGGTAQGLLATGLSLGVALALFHDRIVMLVLAQSSLTLFAVLGVVVSIVLGKLNRANQALSQSRDELSLANKKLAEHTEALARSNGELQRFAYLVAHDLKAPLRAISTTIELCVNHGSELNAELKEPLTLVMSSAKRMDRLIADLLTLAAVSHGEANSGTEVDARRAVYAALQNLRAEVDGSGAMITIDPLPVLWGQEDQLVRLFQNLLSNAIKYRSETRPDIRISASLDDGVWRFLVADNGIGIDPKYHTLVFEPFQRLHRESQYDGSGLGLFICGRIVEQHAGRIWVESAAGKGSRFCFTLPALVNTLPQNRNPALAMNAADTQRLAGA